jgi:hypothetical protein
MDANDVAAQQHSATLAAQMMLCGLSDDPMQFRDPPLTGIFRQAWNERFGHGGGIDYLHVPF